MSSVSDRPPSGKPKGKYGAEFRELWLLQIMADPELVPRHFKVAYVLAMHTNTYSGQIYPSRETVVRLANVCERTVDRAMNFLESRDHLKRHTKFNAAKRTRHMRCWPILKRTNLSQTRDRTVHNLWTKVAEDTLTRDTLTRDTHILTATVGTVVTHGDSTTNKSEVDFRDSNGSGSFYSTASPPSVEAQCYAEAREIPDGNRSAGIVAKALKIDFWDAAEALEVIREVKADGGDSDELAQALWKPNW